MKNAIIYYYNLNVDDIKKNNDGYFFESGSNSYLLQELYRSSEEVYELYNLENFLYSYNIYLHQFIFNNNKELITKINDKYYVLMKLFVNSNEKISIADIKNIEMQIPYNFSKINKNNWRLMWMDKVDYIEYQINEKKFKYKKIRNCIDYYIGLTENAIMLLYGINIKNNYISYYRLKNSTKKMDLYNPLNIIIDSRVRNICEYLKSSFLSNKIDLNFFLNEINNCNFSNDEKRLFFARLLFPSSFFDLYDLVVSDKISEDVIDKYNSNISRYEELLKLIYSNFYLDGALPEIEWIKK